MLFANEVVWRVHESRLRCVWHSRIDCFVLALNAVLCGTHVGCNLVVLDIRDCLGLRAWTCTYF
jgi:hypothetical protein